VRQIQPLELWQIPLLRKLVKLTLTEIQVLKNGQALYKLGGYRDKSVSCERQFVQGIAQACVYQVLDGNVGGNQAHVFENKLLFKWKSYSFTLIQHKIDPTSLGIVSGHHFVDGSFDSSGKYERGRSRCHPNTVAWCL
jgi:hypothetical protein